MKRAPFHPPRTGTAAFVVVMLLLSGPVSAATASPPVESAQAEIVTVDGTSGGRRFDGVGAISAGGSSRLLVDYPEPERSQILDYLFAPNYGAALDILKVEIGGDTDSTSGAEASHMRRRGEVDCDRGHEWWLMRQAEARNPGIKLYALAWGAPGWFNGGFWSQDNIDYLLAWLGCADQHGLTIDYLGGGNERGWDRDFYIGLAAALDQNGHTGIQVVATDNHHPPDYWGAATEMVGDRQFRDAVDILGEHDVCGWRTTYHHCRVTDDALSLNKPLWDSEQSSEDYAFWGKPLARAMNRHYIDARVTGNLNWALTASFPGNFPAAGTGLLLADSPWSGHYELGQAIWVDAHTTQFTDPGWRYLDSGAGHLGSGSSHVALRAPGSGDYTVVVETADATQAETVRFDVRGGLSTGPVQLWATNLNSADGADDFQHAATIQPDNGSFTATLRPGHVYTLSTTTGQGKGTARPDASRTEQMPLPFTENFDNVAVGGLAPYFSDVMGGYESQPCAGGRSGRCLRQMVTREPILWHGHTQPPTTVIGDPRWWGDYEIAADVLVEQAGSAELIGRISRQAHDVVGGYHLQFSSGNGWKLWSSDEYGGFHMLATGPQSIGVGQWHNVRLRMVGPRLTVLLDGTQVGAVTDTRQRTGNVGLRASRWINAQFDNVRVTPTANWPRFAPQDQLTATATSQYDRPYQGTSFPARNAVDGRPETFWHSAFAPKAPLPQSITVDLGAAHRVRGLTAQPRYDDLSNAMITSYHVYVSPDGRDFTKVATGSWPVSWSTKVAAWAPRDDTRFVRLEAVAGVGDLASVAELNVMLGGGRFFGGSPTDFTGDGRADVVTFPQNAEANVWVAASTGSSFGAAGKWHEYFAPPGETPLTGDFDGDGRDDIVTFTHGARADVHVALSSGSAFGPGVKWHDYFAPSGEVPAVGDVNGDGRDDIITFTQGANGDVHVALSTGSSFGSGTRWRGSFSPGGEFPAVGDVNGDGKDDIITFTQGADADVHVALSTGSSFATPTRWHSFFAPGAEAPRVGDFDGDGKDDIVTFTNNAAGDVYVALSDGQGAFVGSGAAVKWHDFFCLAGEFPYVGDFDGDGRDDVITFTHGDAADAYVALSDGTAFGSGVKWHDRFGRAGEIAL